MKFGAPVSGALFYVSLKVLALATTGITGAAAPQGSNASPPRARLCQSAFGGFFVLCGILIRVAAQLSFYLAVVVQYELGLFCRSVVRSTGQIARGQLKVGVGVGERVAVLRPVTGQGHDGSIG